MGKQRKRQYEEEQMHTNHGVTQSATVLPPVLFLNDACIVVNKRVGDAMEGATPSTIDLPRLLSQNFESSRTQHGRLFMLTAVHRLDVPVTGCALFARTPDALAFLNTCFARAFARKIYWAVVEKPAPSASPIPTQGELVHWIAVDGRYNKSYAHSTPGPDRKEARLRYSIRGEGDHYLFMEIELLTGRHHQIRAQLAALGLHIKGDVKYGSRRSEKGGGIRLHARRLAFPDPLAIIQTGLPIESIESVGIAESGVVTEPVATAGMHHHEKIWPYIQVEAPVINPDSLWKAFESL
ncbi:MAG: RNA pseudouridine synthase [Termitinemataceae bacterium]